MTIALGQTKSLILRVLKRLFTVLTSNIQNKNLFVKCDRDVISAVGLGSNPSKTILNGDRDTSILV